MCTVGYRDISTVVRQQVESERLVGAFPLPDHRYNLQALVRLYSTLDRIEEETT